MIKPLDHLHTKLKISLCCILRDLIFLFKTLSSATTLSWFVKALCFLDLLTESLLFPKCLYQNYLKNQLCFQWLHHSPIDHMGSTKRGCGWPCYYQCHNLSLEMHHQQLFQLVQREKVLIYQFNHTRCWKFTYICRRIST